MHTIQFDTPYEESLTSWIDEPLLHIASLIIIILSCVYDLNIGILLVIVYTIAVFDVRLLINSHNKDSEE